MYIIVYHCGFVGTIKKKASTLAWAMANPLRVAAGTIQGGKNPYFKAALAALSLEASTPPSVFARVG